MPNRLAQETSPYLQQHADNPVDWYPWGEVALAKSRAENKPILLSIGYSACHWCHVMAHESFEDPAVAQVMNEHFVNIKVDREERPDIDQIYQLAHQMLAKRSGGWPLTMFLTPDQVPFFGGTYYPKSARHNLPGFVHIMERVVQAFRERRPEIDEQNHIVFEALNEQMAPPTSTDDGWSMAPIERAVTMLQTSFDREHGGFGAAPKFPHPSDLALLLRDAARRGHKQSLHVVTHTLAKMAAGGIYDHLAGGFCRYSVDAQWQIPHFEKMLYDNGSLLSLYTTAWTATKHPQFARIVAATADWMLREMQSPEGGYYSSFDADSEGEEGKFYVWSRDEIRALLSDEQFAVCSLHLGLDRAPNYETTHWHLTVALDIAAVAEKVGRPAEECERLVNAARAVLLGVRNKRVWPGRDDKILTSWNALAIAGMARAARVFDRPDWLASAHRAVDFILRTLWRNGRLLATYKDGHAHLNAYLDDYAYLVDALIELVQAEFRPADLAFARALADALILHFEDADQGGFFFTSHDHERLIQRTKAAHDGATPAGNGMAAFALNRLGHLTGDVRYIAAAERTVRAFHAQIDQHPPAFATLLGALEELLNPTRMVVLTGVKATVRTWITPVSRQYRPDAMVVAVDSRAEDLPATLARPAPPDGVNAYVCQGVRCAAPVASIEALTSLLTEGVVPGLEVGKSTW
ncbi:MAG: thioredoxin domain-containing protein [Betaproteobacteria bacterium]|nr:thioredoxin domain-containing protein [Betaproteobacteria bacterium]